MGVLFSILDKVGEGQIDKTVLADGLENIRGDEDFQKKAAAAATLVLTEISEEYVNVDAFEKILPKLCTAMDCVLDELADILVLQVSFSGKHDAMVPVRVMMMGESEKEVGLPKKVSTKENTVKDLRIAMKDTRMKALFDVFDESGAGVVQRPACWRFLPRQRAPHWRAVPRGYGMPAKRFEAQNPWERQDPYLPSTRAPAPCSRPCRSAAQQAKRGGDQ